ncbi:MAG: integrase [Acidobacteria bacterium]|nr:MAG: integrase [Acidobacteriota bacterium]PYQ84857.1 MAG: integrase [Acidobacteriota bacterium]PYR11935.1 MAG: integrase [Acidobacteriota bacterium]
MAMTNVLTAPRSSWQNGVIERFIGSVRRECLDHVIIFNANGLQRILKSYMEYYERSRTHLALQKDAPVSRPVSPTITAESSRFHRSAGFIIGTNVAA